MVPHRREPSGGVSGDSQPGLENHLRNLIISNGSPAHEALNRGPPASAPIPQNESGNMTISVEASDGAPHQSKPARKRLNQAQRRQMSSQLSISIDPRAQQPPPNIGYQSPTSQHSRPAQPYQRHMHTESQPWGVSGENRQSGSYPHRHWNGSQQLRHRGYDNAPPSFRGRPNSMPAQSNRGSGYLYNARRAVQFHPEEIAAQDALLDQLCFQVVSNSEIERSEIAEKENFRCRIEAISREVIANYEKQERPETEFQPLSVQLKCFGSLSSGFATKASDMDLGLLSPMSASQPDAPGSPIPRLLEKAFLEAGLGARLLTRTRVPIIKLCESPPEKLRQGLLEERFRWENGLDEPHENHEDYEQDPQAAPNDHESRRDLVTGVQDNPSNVVEPMSLNSSEEATKAIELKQGPKSSLSSYYGLAKRVLRRAGGRDATISNYRVLSDEDWTLLNKVSEAFINGLTDTHLRDRLSMYPSLTFTQNTATPTKRSLLGVYTQAEGEQIRQRWEESGVEERNPASHSLTEQAFKAWEDAQYSENFGADPIFFTKELQLALDKLKKAPSVQFVVLEQGQHETPVSYYTRALYIFNGLKPANEKAFSKWRIILATQYVAGIHQEEIRKTLQSCIAICSESLSLRGVGLLHKCIHLAWEFERALDKDSYDESVVQDVKDYIALLRSPLQQDDGLELGDGFFIPITPSTVDLVARIRQLPDPHKMSPNQPRDRYRDHLEFPKTGAGVQCDINFSAHLALHNTALLRCYSHTDPRVRPMVLFVKHWAKTRGINSGYRGTLSSYGYVLMVLHYLVNVAEPFVSPNLQQLAPPPPPGMSPVEFEDMTRCRGHNVQFWRNEEEILNLARANQLNGNKDTIGHLLRGFFEYYAHSSMLSTSTGRGFDWGRDVLSLRTPGGLQTKQDKGWTGAKTVIEAQNVGAHQPPQPDQAPSKDSDAKDAQPKQSIQGSASVKNGEFKEVRHRYLFAIEDPFELDHNVARTVTHNGIVSIRDEFRRAWKIIKSAGNGSPQEDLLQDVNDVEEESSPLSRLLDEIHGLGQTRNA
ncbi:caffeine-induced death 1 cid1 [Fusarium beomiforme]|uniref:polynucleotide adenylyltransferase n=1 Tax=Fusarium beomiforme TaxID=44412 RepID=A0A9P5AG76_9HYPO|nr:caffeine-induced death 1 cid1 [Fusarium beomiforme]